MYCGKLKASERAAEGTLKAHLVAGARASGDTVDALAAFYQLTEGESELEYGAVVPLHPVHISLARRLPNGDASTL